MTLELIKECSEGKAKRGRSQIGSSFFFPFSLILEEGSGEVELIPTSYEALKAMVVGINTLISNKKHCRNAHAMHLYVQKQI